MRALLNLGRPLQQSWARAYSQRIAKTAEPLDLNDFRKDKQIFTEWNRHELWLATQLSSGKEFVLKKMNGDYLWERARETGTPIEILGSPEEEARFRAETEVFLTSFMQRLAPEHTPKSVHIVSGYEEDGSKQYHVASEFEDHYMSFKSLNIKGKEKFFVGEKGETRLLLNIDPFKHIAIYGRIRTKLAVNAMVEWDSNPENIGVIHNPSRIDNADERHRIFSIDHEVGEELCQKPDYRAANIFEMAKKLASGNSFSVYECMELNHLDIARREVVRQESVEHIYNIFKEEFLSPNLFNTRLSRDYSPDYQKKIYNIGGNLQIKGAIFAAANTLIQNGWDKSEEHAESIFAQKYAKNGHTTNQHHIWDIETGREKSRMA